MPVLFKLKDHFKEAQLYLNRTVVAACLVIALFGILIMRLAYLQILNYDLYTTQSRNNHVRVVHTAPPRGLIYDRNGILLADNIPTYSLQLEPSRIKNIDLAIADLSKIMSISEDEIETFKKQLKYKGRYENVLIKTKLSEEEVAAFAVEKDRFPGIEVVATLSRHYPYKEILAHLQGYVGPISEADLQNIDINKYRGIHYIGKIGIEKSYEDLLRGNYGFQNVETDARGRVLRILEETKPIPGKNLHLTIDINLQTAAYDILHNMDARAAIVALDAKTGAILAMASTPSYDPNLFVQGIDRITYASLQADPNQPMFDRTIRGQYPPGSTIKPLIVIEALERGIITPNGKFYDPGYYQIKGKGRVFHDWKREGHGIIDVTSAIRQSCTTYFYFLADKLGIAPIHQIFTKFGMGEKTGVDLPGESSGLAPSANWKLKAKGQPWFHGETLSIGIGQGYTLTTPLQVARNAVTIANKGEILRPYVVLDIKQKQIIGQVKINNLTTWDLVINGMQEVVGKPGGTLHYIYNSKDSYTIAGKTGTSQVFGLKQNEQYNANKISERLRDHSWTMAFAPASDPEIAVAVILENNVRSGKIAKAIFDKYFEDKQSAQK
jgi:penicillin-binding protein 2